MRQLLACLMLLVAWASFSSPSSAQSKTGLADLAKSIREAGLDAAECYRVRDLDLTREDARIYLTDGFLIFGKPVNDRRFSAVFIGEIDGGDAEILMLPPTRSERMSLAKFTESPNLSEHFRFAAFLFTDQTYDEVTKRVAEGYVGRKVSEAGPMFAERYDGVVKNLSESLELRLVRDIMDDAELSDGFFFASMRGARLGNFDFILDLAIPKGLQVGQFSSRNGESIFDVWTAFEPRSILSGRRPAPSEPYRTDHFTIDATLEPDLLLRARTRIRVIPQNLRKTIAMQLAEEMRIHSAWAGGQELEVYHPASMRLNSLRQDRDSVFLVRLPDSASPGTEIEIDIEHSGKVVRASGNDVFYVGSRGSWYPGSGRHYATYDLQFRLDRNLNFVSTGDIVERIEDGSAAIYRIKVEKPVRTFGFNLGRYKTVTRERNGFTVNVMANKQVESALEPPPRVVVVPAPPPPSGRRQSLPDTYAAMAAPRPDPTQRLRDLGNEVVSLLEDFTERFGPPPVRTINVSPIPGHFGQGFAGMIYLSTMTYLHESQRPQYVRDEASRVFFSNLLLAHELSHQWWGNLVYTQSDQDEWLMEGLATYSSLLVLEKQKGRKAVEEVLLRYREHLLSELGGSRTVESAGPVIWGTRLINSRDRNAWMTIIYEKGAWIFHMLRARMGDESFARMLKGLPDRFASEPMTTASFQKFASGFLPEDSDDKDLEDFFAQWVQSTGIPKLSIETSVSGTAPKVTVEVELSQSMVPDDFGALVPIHILLPRGQKEVRWVRASNDGEEFSFTVPAIPTRIELDPEWTTLRRD